MILPGAAYTEKSGMYVNTEGRPQIARAVVSPPGLAKEDWQILRALSEELGVPLPYNNLEEIRERIAELAPHLVKYDYVESTGFEDIAYKVRSQQKAYDSLIIDEVDVIEFHKLLELLHD